MSSVRVFDELGFLPILEREGFPRKYGASWHPPVVKGQADISFDEFPQTGISQEYTYHVDRQRFDLLPFAHRRAGSGRPSANDSRCYGAKLYWANNSE
jgi:FADH2 O2-dependent halogenase